jgi:hypothetical protein
MLMRHGIRLRAKEAAIFDAIEAVSRRNDRISAMTLAIVLYPDGPTPAAVKTIAVHVNHINDRLAETNLEICGGRNGYQLRRYT